MGWWVEFRTIYSPSLGCATIVFLKPIPASFSRIGRTPTPVPAQCLRDPFNTLFNVYLETVSTRLLCATAFQRVSSVSTDSDPAVAHEDNAAKLTPGRIRCGWGNHEHSATRKEPQQHIRVPQTVFPSDKVSNLFLFFFHRSIIADLRTTKNPRWDFRE